MAPVKSGSEGLSNSINSNTWTATVNGTTPAWQGVRNRTVTQGRFIDNQDVTDHTAVAVLGPTTASELFSGIDPVGQTVNVNGVPLTVVGVLNSVGDASSTTGTNQDDQVVIPLSTATQRIFGSSSLSSILIEADSGSSLSSAYQEADAELLALHGIDQRLQRRLHHLVPGVTGVDLHVGRPHPHHPAGRDRRHLAPGRRDRRHEHHAGLGHRASARDRPAQGPGRQAVAHPPPVPPRGLRSRPDRRRPRASAWRSLGTTFLPKAIGYPVALSGSATAGAIGVAVAIGVVFGVYPASRAARLAPIDALRSE